MHTVTQIELKVSWLLNGTKRKETGENMNVRLLDLEEIREVYETYMVEDFPADELKPFLMIEKMFHEGRYEVLGVMDQEKLVGYANFVKIGNDYLFDYLAISKEMRNQGIGSEFLDAIREHYKDADSIIGEVEDFNLSTGAERELQERRYHFYLRNGLVDTNVKVWMFDVDYIVLMMPAKKTLNEEDVKQLYLDIYRAMLPEELFKAKVRVK